MSSFFRKIGTKVAAALGAAGGKPASASAPQREVLDVAGNRHRLAAELGRGGQGAVFRTSNREIAAKLLLDPSGEPLPADGSAEDLGLRRAIERVLTLPLPATGIAAPIAPLRGQVGYTMRMLDGMQPIGRLLAMSGTPAEHYRNTGGLRRRLAILATLADRMASLHAVGLVFTDLSPNNAFISASTDASEVWLIDPDNIHYVQQRVLRFYTPRYGAPEIVSGRRGADTMSDCWSFAVIAHEILRMAHPFEGDGLEDAGWDVTVSGVQKPGEPPLVWIDDPNDASNRTSNGLRLAVVATRRMSSLFERVFCAGRGDPTARPSMQEWSDALWDAHGQAVVCPKCGGSSFVRQNAAMDCCGASRPALLRVESRMWVPDLDEDLFDLAQSKREVARTTKTLDSIDPDRVKDEASAVGPALPQRRPLATMRFTHGLPAEVPASLVGAVDAERRRMPGIELRTLAGKLVVEIPDGGRGWKWIDAADGRLRPIERKFEVALDPKRPQAFHIHCGAEDEAHRLLTFVYFAEDANAG